MSTPQAGQGPTYNGNGGHNGYGPGPDATSSFDATSTYGGQNPGYGGQNTGPSGPSGPPPLGVSVVGATPGAAPVKKRRGLLALGVGIGVLGLAGGGAFAYSQIAAEEKPNTPEQAVESFYKAVADGDFITMAKTLAPGERDVMLDSVVPMVGEMSRLGLLDSKLDLNKVPGYEGKFEKFSATSKQLRDDLAEVTVTQGSLNFTFDKSKLPIGDFLKDLVGKDLIGTGTSTTNISNDTKLVVNKVGKRWYLSMNYNIAEAARRGTGDSYEVPARDAGVAPRGADSAEQAVSDMLVAMGNVDVRRMTELLPPDEFAAVHDYAGRWIGRAEDATKKVKDVVDLKLSPKLRTKSLADDRAMVFIEDLPMKLKVDQNGTKVDVDYANKNFTSSLSIDDGNGGGAKGDATLKDGILTGKFDSGSGDKLDFDYRNNCLKLTSDGETKKGCGQQGIAKLIGDLTGTPIDTSQLNAGGLGISNKCQGSAGKPEVGFVAIKREGKWFVSPSRTMLDSITGVMKKLDRKSLDCIKKQIEEAVKTATGSVSDSASDSTFQSPIDGSDPFAGSGDAAPTDSTTADTFSSTVDTLPADDFPAAVPSDSSAVDTSAFGGITESTDTLPSVGLTDPALLEKPSIVIPAGNPPSKLQTEDLVVGEGPIVRVGDNVETKYVGVSWSTGEQFDSSWDGGTTFMVEGLGSAPVIEGWNKGIVGMRVGGRRKIVVPASLGYGDQSVGGIAPNETLVFVVDVVATSKP